MHCSKKTVVAPHAVVCPQPPLHAHAQADDISEPWSPSSSPSVPHSAKIITKHDNERHKCTENND